MRITQSISKDEQEWLKEFDELRNKLDEGERIYQAKKLAKNELTLELIHRNYSLGRTIEEIAEILGMSKSEVETILKLKP